MSKNKMKLLGIVGQLCAIALVSIGLGYEIGTGAHLGYVLITTGALCFGIFTKVRHYYGKD